MKQTIYAPKVPTVNITVNKSRIKLYTHGLDLPTYYLQKGQEFQLELFNPTSDVILCKIILNGKHISQGGLVLNPAQRVFLDRFLDVPKKFLFDTYEVGNTAEIKKAIENNGDIKVEFYKEQVILPFYLPNIFTYTDTTGNYFGGTINNTNYVSGSLTSSSSNLSNVSSSNKDLGLGSVKRKLSKSLETGRIEKGSDSNQKIDYVNKNFEFSPFHTIEYKMLPISQKINDASDLNVKRYCTNCGSKLGKTDKFCANCGAKA